MKKTKSIPTLKDDGFKVIMSYYDPMEFSKKNFNDFYIHGLSDDTYELKMPLLSHRQGNHSIIMVTKGSIVTSSGIDIYTVGQNAMIVVPAGQITRLSFMSDDIEGFYLHFANGYLSHAKIDLSDWLIRPVIKFEEAESQHLLTLLRRMQKLNESETNTNIIKLYLATFLTEINRTINSRSRTNFAAHERITLEFKKLLNGHLTRERSVRFYAAELNVTPNHLNKSVKMTLGHSASSMIEEMLILEAKILMQRNDMSISDIATATGFDDVSYFGRFFKKHTSSTPKQYRKLIELSE